MKEIPHIIFPIPEFKVKNENGMTVIWDEFSKIFRKLSPEEWVRQIILSYLVKDLAYSKNLIQIEREIKIQKQKRRTDICIFDKQGKPYVIIECKSPEVKLETKTWNQISQYQEFHQAKFLVISNGLAVEIFDIEHKKLYNQLAYIPLPQ